MKSSVRRAASTFVPSRSSRCEPSDKDVYTPSVMGDLYQIRYESPRTVYQHNDCFSRLFSPAFHRAFLMPASFGKSRVMDFLERNIEWEVREPGMHYTAWYVDRGWEVDYEYDVGSVQPWHHMPEWMLLMRSHMLDTLNWSRDTPPNACNLNWYVDGNASLGAHSDDEYLFAGLEQAISIVSISFGSSRDFQILENVGGQWKVVETVVLPEGAYLTMEGWFQKYLRHAVPKCADAGPRINLTWRWIVHKTKDEAPVNCDGL